VEPWRGHAKHTRGLECQVSGCMYRLELVGFSRVSTVVGSIGLALVLSLRLDFRVRATDVVIIVSMVPNDQHVFQQVLRNV